MIRPICLKRPTLWLVLALSTASLAAFWPVLHNGFILYDDPDYVTENPAVLKGLTSAGVAWAFQTAHAGNWHPLTWISHMVDIQCFGLNPGGHHLVSLLIHVLSSVILLLALKRLSGALWRSAWVAAMFALHPLHVESVAWIAERKDVLSGFFFMLALWSYAGYAVVPRARPVGSANASQSSPRRPRFFAPLLYALSLVCFALGLMSKPMLVTLPFVLLLLDYWPLARFPTASLPVSRYSLAASIARLVVEKVPFLALSVASCVITFLVQHEAGAVGSLEALPLGFRLSNALVAYVRYLGKLFWPQSMAVFYPLPEGYPVTIVLGAVLVLALITLLVFFGSRRVPALAVGWCWYVGMMVPVIGLVQVGQQAMADRYSYLPSIGIFVILAWVGEALVKSVDRAPQDSGGRSFAWVAPFAWKPLRPTWISAMATAILMICAMLTWRQARHWHNTNTLFSHALDVTRNNHLAHNNLGVALLKANDVAAAEPHFAEAVRLQPKYAEALLNLGLCREKEGQPREAIAWFIRALQNKPTAPAHYNLARLLAAEGRHSDAEAHYRSALALKPDLVEGWYNLGALLAQMGRANEALECYDTALGLRPDYADAHLSLGAMLITQKQTDQALAHFEAAVRVAPQNPDTHFNLAMAAEMKGDHARAEAEYREVCRLRPEDLEARSNLGLLLMETGQPEQALDQFEAILRVRADPQTHYLAALILDSQGKFASAIEHYRAAIGLNPKAAVYLNDLAWLLATAPEGRFRDGPEAVRMAELACSLAGDKEPRFWGTLDAAYAEAGRFDQAIATAEKTRKLALAAGQEQIAQAAANRLEQYRERTPYHQAIRTQSP